MFLLLTLGREIPAGLKKQLLRDFQEKSWFLEIPI